MSREDGEAAGGENYRIQLVSRVFSVLFSFSKAEPYLALDDLARRLEINKSSLLRILRSLENEGMVHRDGERYSLGPGVLQLANNFLRSLSVHEVAQPYMEQLARECGQTATLAILEDLDVIYIVIEHAQTDVGILGGIGQRYPAHATAVGKALLAHLSEAELARRVDGKPLRRLTHRTIVEPNMLAEELARTRSRGYSIDDEERGVGIRCVAVPIFDHTGHAKAALSLSGPIFHLTHEAVPEYGRRLVEVGREVSERLGHVSVRPDRVALGEG